MVRLVGHGSLAITWKDSLNQIGAPLKPLQFFSWTDAAFWHFL